MKILKNAVFIVSILSLFYSCSNQQKSSSKFPEEDFKKFDTILSFSGSWISEHYYNTIKQFKSPKSAQDESQYIVIPERTLRTTMIIYGFHEGGSSLTVLKRNDNYELWELSDDSATQKLETIQIISPDEIKIGNTSFVKMSSETAQDEHKILEQLLFEGSYISSAGHQITLRGNGHVIGLDKFTYYEPVIDYFDVASQIDQIGLGQSSDNLEYFGFKFNNDTLELYQINCLTFDTAQKQCVEVDYGQLKYKLYKQ